jgi:hypothetical protein
VAFDVDVGRNEASSECTLYCQIEAVMNIAIEERACLSILSRIEHIRVTPLVRQNSIS